MRWHGELIVQKYLFNFNKGRAAWYRVVRLLLVCQTDPVSLGRWEGVFPYNGRYGEAPPERGTFFRFQVYESEGISLVEVYERVGKSVIWVCERPKEPNR